MSEGTYPLPRPEVDSRFNAGLIHEVAKAIEAAGYPAVTNGGDLLDLQGALFRFLYSCDTGTGTVQ